VSASVLTGECLKTDLRPPFGLTSPPTAETAEPSVFSIQLRITNYELRITNHAFDMKIFYYDSLAIADQLMTKFM